MSTNSANADNCENIGEIGTSGSCNGKLIVSRQNLLDAISDESYAVVGPDNVSYTFAEGGTGDIYSGNIEDFSKLFLKKRNFNQDIGYWNTSKATNMREMFRGARNFDQDLSNWQIDDVEDMSGMFRDARNFNNGDESGINNWNTGKVTNMSNLFNNARKFNHSLNSWNTEEVENMNSIFKNAWIFNSDIDNWETKKVRNFASAFKSTRVFNRDISNWNVGEATRMNYFLSGNDIFDKDLSAWNVRKVKEQNAQDFAPNLSSEKNPCWGFYGCAEASNAPVLNSYLPNGFNVSHSDDTKLILSFDRAVKGGEKKSIHLWKKNDDGKYSKRKAFNLNSSADITDKETTTNITINIGKYLDDDTEYFIIIPNDSILSASTDTPFLGRYKKYHQEGSLSFSTGNDSSPLTFLGSSPVTGTSKLEVENPKIELRFSEGIAFGSGSISLIEYDNENPIRVLEQIDLSSS